MNQNRLKMRNKNCNSKLKIMNYSYMKSKNSQKLQNQMKMKILRAQEMEKRIIMIWKIQMKELNNYVSIQMKKKIAFKILIKI